MLTIPVLLATISSTVEINALPRSSFKELHPVALTGRVVSVLKDNHFVLEDASGRTHVRNRAATHPARGDKIALTGHTGVDTFGQEQTVSTNLVICGQDVVNEPVTRSIRRIAEGACDYENVRVTGFISACARDDLDAQWSCLVLSSGYDCIYVTIPDTPGLRIDPTHYVRATATVTGTVIPNHCGARLFIGPHVETTGGSDIQILSTAEDDVQPLEALGHLQPHEVVRRNFRTIEGRVRAVWGGKSLLLASDDGDIHRIDLDSGIAPPPCDSRIRAKGFPETDLYRINLSRASYEILDASRAPSRERTVDATKVSDPAVRPIRFHGHAVRFSGRVLDDPDARNGHRATVERDGLRLAVDVSNLPSPPDGLTSGAEVEVTGCGLVETDNWRPGMLYPEQKDLVLVTRQPSDIVILRRSPWWTPGRLFAVILLLATILTACLIWNFMLNRLVERRGRALLREELAHAEATLKTAERTRLAVELHDSLSQTLTGIACQVDAADRARLKDPAHIADHLDLVRRTIDSCRSELRNCLWDLRNHTLEEADAATAIRRTVTPHAGEALVEIDFGVRRNLISDNTFHEILCILRELVANAVRHGQATRIDIRGRSADGLLTLTVTDDGCGFDPEKRPGTSTGHFGLLGVTERLSRLNGTLDMKSAPGHGATFTITIRKQT